MTRNETAHGHTDVRLIRHTGLIRWSIGFVTCCLILIPYVVGYVTSSPQHRFQGILDYGPDIQSYFMWMRSSADHAGLPPNLYHTLPEKPYFFHLLWVGIGKINRHTGVPILFLYHLTHALGIVFFLLALWRFVGRFFTEKHQAIVAYGVCILGSGVGWYTVMLDPSLIPVLRTKPALPEVSLDLWSADVNSFYSLLVSPHFAVALWLLVAAMDRLYMAVTRRDNRACLVGAFLALLLGFVHTYDVFTVANVGIVFGVLYILLNRYRLDLHDRLVTGARCLCFLLGCAVPVLYYIWAIHKSPTLASWAEQNRFETPGPHFYLQAFGLPAVLMLTYWQSVKRFRRGEPDILFLLTWVATVFVLMYSTALLPFAKRLAEGLQIPIVILAVRCVYDQWLPWVQHHVRLKRWHRLAILTGAAVLVFPTTIFLVCNMTIAATSTEPPFFVTGVELAGFEYLEQHANKGKNVLAPWKTGTILPRYTGMRVYSGHFHITPDFKPRTRLLQKMLWGHMSESEMLDLIRQNDIGYIWLGRYRGRYAGQFPTDAPFLRLWWKRDFVSIYEVVWEVP